MWKTLEMKNSQREQMPIKWKRNGGDKDQNCDGDCIKSDLEREGEERGK